MSCVCVYLSVSSTCSYVYLLCNVNVYTRTRVNALRILLYFVFELLYNRSCNIAKNCEHVGSIGNTTTSRRFDRCPRVVNTFYATHHCRWLSLVFFSLPLLLWEPCSSVRGKNNDEKIDGIKYLKSWGVPRTVVRKNGTVLHDVERIGMVEVHDGEQGNVWHLSHYYFVRYNSYAMYGVESSNFLLISIKRMGDSFFSPA